MEVWAAIMVCHARLYEIRFTVEDERDGPVILQRHIHHGCKQFWFWERDSLCQHGDIACCQNNRASNAFVPPSLTTKYAILS